MVVPFGISVGDFIAVGKLALEIATALSDCRGAAADYKGLIDLLKSLEISLNSITNFLSSSSLGETSNVDQAFMNGVLFHAGRCHTLLSQFKLDSRKYTERLINGQGNKAQKTFRKLKWSLYSTEDARKLQQRLSLHLEAFDRYLLAVNIQLGAQSSHQEAQSTQRLQGQIGHFSSTLTEIVQIVQTIQLNMPKCLGYPWEADVASSHVYLQDVLGRSTILPAVLCRTFNTFHDTLKIMFSDHPGFKEVVRGDFEIIDETIGLPIFLGRALPTILGRGIASAREQDSLTREWVKPGSRLSMSIVNTVLVRQRSTPMDSSSDFFQTDEECPNCGRFQTVGRRLNKW
ncbi:uncharacterized protein Z520_07250 [Fonsecaea multimorphosa CBS 102226]|uniref:Ubiquitin-like domain-containing protein n=1 Tax=Fonsecaea multimorphosa CBS 102226 TaxID=1442371 RepID=A0A0D2IJ98_9EURO|nr:uncharacterized protein Z520_07250 [Fonsecaea multimorphosa CBS 102226]KIX97136.1 hypothetical protein Z520_07250 [Fonsecaea multimorphosa CBS 102226]OAL22911.1 hypothetical protein AYO22_06819 [Fonsecaea multimorphosa]